MTFKPEIVTENFDKLVKVAGIMLKVAQDGEATPQDAIEVLDSVVDQLSELRQSIPGGSEGPEEQEQKPEEKVATPAEKPEPAAQGAALEKDTVEEGREKVNEQNAAQKALGNKTYSMNAKEITDLQNQLLAAKTRIDELEGFKVAKEKEEIAEAYSDLYPLHLRKAKFDEVINSEESPQIWTTRIAAISEFQGNNSVKPAKTESHWLPTKTAKQRQSVGLKRI